MSTKKDFKQINWKINLQEGTELRTMISTIFPRTHFNPVSYIAQICSQNFQIAIAVKVATGVTSSDFRNNREYLDKTVTV